MRLATGTGLWLSQAHRIDRRGGAQEGPVRVVRFCGAGSVERVPGMQIHFASKKANLPGLQLADLVARPIGRHVLSLEQHNRAFDIIRPKLRKGPQGQVEGHGLKVFP